MQYDKCVVMTSSLTLTTHNYKSRAQRALKSFRGK